jgi:hypothetical protein
MQTTVRLCITSKLEVTMKSMESTATRLLMRRIGLVGVIKPIMEVTSEMTTWKTIAPKRKNLHMMMLRKMICLYMRESTIRKPRRTRLTMERTLTQVLKHLLRRQ